MQKIRALQSSLPLLAFALVVIGSPARAQNTLSTPAGWSKSTAAGDIVFSESANGPRIVIQKLTPLNGDLRSWFEAQVERDSKSRGRISDPGRAQFKTGNYLLGRNFRSSSGRQSVIYVGYSIGSRGRFLMYSASDPQDLKRSIPDFLATRQQILALDKASNDWIAPSATGANSPPRLTATKSGKAVAGAKVAVGLSPAASAARDRAASGKLLGVFLNESYMGGVGGMPVLTYEPVLLLRDGSARRNVELPPGDVIIASDKAAHARDWGRWTRSGDKMKVRWSDGDTDELRASYKSRPARPGETLSGSFRSLSGGGNTALGGSIMTFSSNEYTFAHDGRFATERSGGGTSPGFTASSSSKNGGRYRLDGHTLTLKFNDGRVVRRLFFFYPGKNEGNVLGIGDSAFVGDD